MGKSSRVFFFKARARAEGSVSLDPGARKGAPRESGQIRTSDGVYLGTRASS